ncbi:MAG: twin-arginine translocase subunit TatC [Desulfobacteraceae bacterium]|jgi:sec-independent protein translocase protein TatC
MESEEKQPFMSHLEELRKRLVVCAISVGVGFVAAYFFAEYLFQILTLPLKQNMAEDQQLIFTNLPEMFFAYLKTALVTGILASAPVIFYQLYMFVAPGLYRSERKLVVPFVIVSTILFVGGSLFGYFIVFPFGFRFFLSFANESIQALPSVKEYFSFAIKLLFAFGLVFELPVVAFFLGKLGIITPELMRAKRKYAILLTFAMGAILTPPDVVTQCMMAGPLIVLYEISIVVVRMARKKKESEEDETRDEKDEEK